MQHPFYLTISSTNNHDGHSEKFRINNNCLLKITAIEKRRSYIWQTWRVSTKMRTQLNTIHLFYIFGFNLKVSNGYRKPRVG